MKRSILLFAILVTALVGTLYLFQTQRSGDAPSFPAPDFGLVDLHGQAQRLSDYRG